MIDITATQKVTEPPVATLTKTMEPTATKLPAATTVAPNLTPGVDVPLIVLGVDLKFVSLEQYDSLKIITKGIEDTVTPREGLVGYMLTAESSNGTMDTIKNWPNEGNKLGLTLSNGEEYTKGTYLGNINDTEIDGFARWRFTVPEGTTITTVKFPDGTVFDLSLLEKN